MARVTELAKYKVAILGDSRDFSKSIKAVSQDVHGLGNRFKIAGYGMKQMLHGNVGAGWKTLKQSMGGFMRNADGSINKSKLLGASMMGLATVTAGVTVALYAMHRAVTGALDAWGNYVKTISEVNRLTGISYAASGQLVGQWKLLGVETTKGATGIKFFAKNLDQARQGVKSYADAFNRLGVNIKGKSTAQVLNETRDAISKMGKGATSTAMAMKLFGRGGADVLKWLLADNKAMKESKKYIHDLGLEFGKKGVAQFKEYAKEKRKLSLGWEAIKINAGRALGPIVTEYMARISGWIAGNMPQIRKAFRKWATVIENLLPYFGKIVGKLAEWGVWVATHEADIYLFFTNVKTAAQNVSDAINTIANAMDRVRDAYNDVTGGGAGVDTGYRGSGGGGGYGDKNPVSSNRAPSRVQSSTPSVVITGGTFIGGTPQQVARAIEGLLVANGRAVSRGYA